MVVRAAGLSDPPAGYSPPFTAGQFSLNEHYLNARKAAYAGLLDGLRGLGPGFDFFTPATRGEVAEVLTGDRRYAHVLSVLLDALAAIYPSCDKGPVWYPGVGGRLNRPFYQTARTLIYYANVYDLTYDSPEWDLPSCDPAAGTRRTHYEQNLLRNGAAYCFGEVTKQKSPALHNGNCDYLQGALAVGRVLAVAKYIDFVLESDLSIFNFIDNTIDRDGQYYETSFSYSLHAVELFSHHAEMLRNFRSPKYPQGVNLYDLPKLRSNYLRAERDIDCAGHQPARPD